MKKFFGISFLIFGAVSLAYAAVSPDQTYDEHASVVIEDGIDDNGDLVKVETVAESLKEKKVEKLKVTDDPSIAS